MNKIVKFSAFLKPHLVSAFVLFLPVSAWAYHPLITDDTGTQGTGGNQIEIGYNMSRAKDAGVTDKAGDVPFVYTRGLSDTLDGIVGLTRQTKPVHGWGNTSVGAKWRFYDDEKSGLSLGLKPEIRLPVSKSDEAKGLGQGETSYAMTLLVSQETGFGAVHLNAAVERNGYANPTTDRKTLYRVSVAPVWHVAEHWKLALDTGVQTNADSSRKSRMGFVELGAIYSPNEDLDLSVGVIRDLMDGPVTSTSVTAELTWRFR